MRYVSDAAKQFFIKHVPTSIPKSDLLHVTMAVIHVAGQRFWQYEMALTKYSSGGQLM